MEVLLVETEGRGLSAEIEVDGERLVVVDGISRVGEPAAPGPVSRPRFQVVAPEPASWERASSRNPDRSKKLEHLRGWRYLGFGEILSTEPARLDLGVLVLELDLRIGDEGQVGRYVGIDIDRITLSREGPGAREARSTSSVAYRREALVIAPRAGVSRSRARAPVRCTRGSTVEHPNARIARRLWDAASEGDADAIREVLAPDVRWHSYDSGILSGEFHGPDAVVDRLARSGEVVDNLRSTLMDIYASERGAVLHYSVVAQRGGQQLETEILLVERIEAGRIVEIFTVPRDAERNARFWQNH